MTNDEKLQKYTDAIEAAKNRYKVDVSVGDLYLYYGDSYIKITGIYAPDGAAPYVTWIKTRDGIEWGNTGRTDFEWLNYSNNKSYVKIAVEVGQFIPDAISELHKEATEAFLNPSKLETEADNASSESSIVAMGSKSYYERSLALLEQRKARVQAIRNIMESKMDALSNIAHDLSKKLTKIQKVVGVIELYLGVHEDIVQLQYGNPADTATKVTIRQLVLYMDEEVAVAEGGGIDFRRVNEFDEWLLIDNNIDFILPEKKGIVALCPSRQIRNYSDDVFDNSRLNNKNKMLYLLIRNGENIYRIWASIPIGSHLFPTLKENEAMEKIMMSASRLSSWDEEKIEDTKLNNMRNALIIQGIIDRTVLLQPLPNGHIDMFAAKTYEADGYVNLLRDAEMTLSTGRMSYPDWHTQINSYIKRGSRVVYVGIPWSKDGHINRFGGNYSNYTPPLPNKGIYKIHSIETKSSLWYKNREALKILYKPSDELFDSYAWAYVERKRRIAFYLYRDDSFVLNYDAISLEDIDYYLNCRLERIHYLDMMPILFELRKSRLEELEKEKHFVALVAHEMHCKELDVWKWVEWWKTKNIWKRPITEDDSKAWRMIKSKLSNELT